MSLDRTERTDLPEHDSNIKRALDKGVRAEKLGQDSWYRTAWTGQPRQDSWDRKARQENGERKVRKTDKIVQPG